MEFINKNDIPNTKINFFSKNYQNSYFLFTLYFKTFWFLSFLYLIHNIFSKYTHSFLIKTFLYLISIDSYLFFSSYKIKKNFNRNFRYNFLFFLTSKKSFFIKIQNKNSLNFIYNKIRFFILSFFFNIFYLNFDSIIKDNKLHTFINLNLFFSINKNGKNLEFAQKYKSLYIKKKSKLLPSINSIRITIRIVPNNIFCTFSSLCGSKTFKSWSAGIKKIKISKRRLFFGVQTILDLFLKELILWRKKFYYHKSVCFYSLQVPGYIRRYILRAITKKTYVINIEYNKAFNGCKAKKSRRKKRISFRKLK